MSFLRYKYAFPVFLYFFRLSGIGDLLLSIHYIIITRLIPPTIGLWHTSTEPILMFYLPLSPNGLIQVPRLTAVLHSHINTLLKGVTTFNPAFYSLCKVIFKIKRKTSPVFAGLAVRLQRRLNDLNHAFLQGAPVSGDRLRYPRKSKSVLKNLKNAIARTTKCPIGECLYKHYSICKRIQTNTERR